MLSCRFTDQVFVCISTGFKCPCAKKHSRSYSFLLSIWYSFGKRTTLVLSDVHFVQGGSSCETSPAATSVIIKCLNFVPSKPINRFCSFLLLSVFRLHTVNSVLHHQNASNEAVLCWWMLWYLECAWSVQAGKLQRENYGVLN